MPRRVSLKGQGASIFFGDAGAPTRPRPDEQAGPEATHPAPPPLSTRPPERPVAPEEPITDPSPSGPSPSRPIDRPTVRAMVAPTGRAPVRRVSIRHSFELYQDQLDDLRQLSLEQKLQGDIGSMSEMVREAIDEWLAGRHRRSA